MKIIHTFSVAIIALIGLAAWSPGEISAQDKPVGGERRPTPTPTPRSIITGRSITDRIQPQNVRSGYGIYGTIRWKKAYGLPSTDGGRSANRSLNCGAFRVQATVQSGEPGTFGKGESVGYYTIQNEPTEANGYYTCRYSFTDQNPIPRGRVITVSAHIGAFANTLVDQTLISGRWFGTTEQLPAGLERVTIGSRGVTLSDRDRHATVDFEMVYKPVPQGPR
jgi:hypothetical protein